MLIEILVFPGVDELDALGPFEVLRGAVASGANFHVRLVTLEKSDEVQASYGLRFAVEDALGSAGRPDILVIPGGGWVKRAERGAWAEAQRGAIPAAIAKAYQSGTLLASVCTGAMLIATAGLLKGRKAVTHHGAIEELRQSGAEIVSARVVDDGDIISAGGVTSGIDLALYLIERFAGKQIADQSARNLEYERRGPVHISADSSKRVAR
jgi:transcriptional regulator GlxA family with amidase domain